MPWDDFPAPELLTFYRQLIHFRQAHSSVWRRSRRAIVINDKQGLYAYSVGDFLIVLHNSERPVTVMLPEQQAVNAMLLSTVSDAFEIESSRELHLATYEGAIFAG